MDRYEQQPPVRKLWIAALDGYEERLAQAGVSGPHTRAVLVARHIADNAPDVDDSPWIELSRDFARDMMVALHIVPVGLQELLCWLVQEGFMVWDRPEARLFYADLEASWGRIRLVVPDVAEGPAIGASPRTWE